jgi:uncharacterized protein (TIGR02217 family)
MSYPVFPTVRGLSWNITRTPSWETLVQRSSSGMEFRLQYWQYPLWKWELNFAYLKDNPSDLPPGYTQTDLAVIQGFFNMVAGQYGVFIFDDVNAGDTPGAGPWDSVTNQAVATGDGTTTTFQLLRSSGGFTDAIQAPYTSPEPIVYLNGVAQTYGANYAIDATGNIIFATAPGAGVAITWTGAYYWPCRFSEDEEDFDTQLHQLWTLKKISFVQVRL